MHLLEQVIRLVVGWIQRFGERQSRSSQRSDSRLTSIVHVVVHRARVVVTHEKELVFIGTGLGRNKLIVHRLVKDGLDVEIFSNDAICRVRYRELLRASVICGCTSLVDLAVSALSLHIYVGLCSVRVRHEITRPN